MSRHRTLILALLALVTLVVGLQLVRSVLPPFSIRLVLAEVIAGTSFDAWFHQQASKNLHRLERSVRPGDVMFIGDSHILGMNLAAVAPNAVNFAIGGDTSEGVLARLRTYPSLARVRAVVIAIGYNDLPRRSAADVAATVAEMLEVVPAPVVLSAIPPINHDLRPDLPNDMNKIIADLNRAFATLCREQCRYVLPTAFAVDDAGNLRLSEPDGVHLTPEGYDQWMTHISAALKDPGMRQAPISEN